jgi:putative restriction endonuclease
MRQSDHSVRLAAFRFLEEQVRLSGEFWERVVRAYQHHCAVCRLKRDELLEAAHIVPDADPLGAPVVPNGVALCRLRHAAFDRYLIGIRPDCVLEVRRDVLDDTDGPMSIHGLQGFHGTSLLLPRIRALRPDPVLLEVRYERFRQAG